MIKKCFVDMDDVIVDFAKEVCRMFGLEYPPREYEFFEPIRNDVNGACDESFWENLKWTQDGKAILAKIEYWIPFGRIYFLSAPMPNPGSWTGKFRWIQRELPRYEDRLIITNRKLKSALFASEENLLIDDSEEQYKAFIAAGGQAILVPRSYNSLRASDPVEHVRKELAKLIM